MDLKTLSPDQAQALERLLLWYRTKASQSITLGGYAGTGKTSLIGVFRQMLDEQNQELRVAFAAYTGKASQVLRQTLQSQASLYKQDSCGTIHSLLYSPEIDKEGQIIAWKRSKEIEADVIIIDEASMVTDKIWFDLLAANKPIIAVGDHGQLPPIGSSFSLMLKPELALERIHRQAEGNPIIQLAHQARLDGKIEPGKYADGVRKYSLQLEDPSEIHEAIEEQLSGSIEDTLFLCGRNSTRVRLNKAIRQRLGRESEEPERGDRVVCLKNHYGRAYEPIYNGMIGVVERIMPKEDHWYQTEIEFPEDERRFEGVISRHQFNKPETLQTLEGFHFKQIGERFDFGYALTVHKAQGSQAQKVVLFEERFQKTDDDQWRRWLYTAVTRAREQLIIFPTQ